MTEFQLRLFGGFQAVLNDADLTRPLSVKAQGILCYLVVTRRPQSRSTIAGLFWGGKPERDARRSLRVELTKLRKRLNPYLDITRQTVTFIGGDSSWVDVEIFDHHLKLAQSADGAIGRSHLREAANLYTGEFLDGYQAGDAIEFEEWVFAQRERYRTAALSALTKLVDLALEQKEMAAGIDYASQLLQIDPWLEKAHRSLMYLYAANGQRGAALRQFETCRQILADELGVEPEPATLTLWQQIKDREDADSFSTQPLPLPSPETVGTVPFQAPAPVPFFTGRDQELALLTANLTEWAQPVVLCIAGMGGVGKSALVTQLAHEVRDDFPDGVLWADATANPDVIAERWTQAYGYDFTRIPSAADRMAAVRALMAQKRALIVLDNVQVAARVKPLLPTEGQSAVVATTRNANLAAMLGAELVNLDVLTLDNGRSLLSSMIGQTRLQNEQAAADQICQTLQSLPLALAIAGQYLASHHRRRLADYARRLAQAPLLVGGDSEGVVRASFDISWSALDQVQQRIFALLAVFNGRSFTAEAMAYIADMDSFQTQDYLDLLAARSLLTERGSHHYQQHALLAQFAQEQLGDIQAPRQRMLDYFLHYAEAHHDNYQELGHEWENLDAVVALTVEQGQWGQLFRLTSALHQAWFARGYFDKARQAYIYAYEGAAALNDESKMADSLFNQGRAVLEQAQYDQARDLFQQACALYARLGCDNQLADVQLELARIHIDQTRFAEAEALLAESLRIKMAAQDELGLAKVKFRQARVANRKTENERALALAQAALDIYKKHEDYQGVIYALHIIFWSHSQLGDYDKALSTAQRTLTLAEEIQDRGELALTLYELAEINRLLKNLDEALSFAQESLEMMEKMGDARSQGLVLYRICLIHRDAGKFQQAIDIGRRCLEIFTKLQDRIFMGYVIGNLGIAYFGLGDKEQAETYLLRAYEIGKEFDEDYWLQNLQNFIDKL